MISCQQVVDRAKGFSILNTPLTADRTEMLSRIQSDQQDVFTEIAGDTRDRFQTTATLASTVASAGRVFDLSTLAPPLERALTLVLGDGREASQVDLYDLEAELKPRYLVRGQTIVEVANDWNTASAISVTATLTYVYGPTPIDLAGQLSQAISLPDAWVDLLALPLAIYLFQKDPGRDPAEGARLEEMLTNKQRAFVTYLTNYGGLTARRFEIPSPQSAPQKK